nr:MAG TPA: hypothetical protein [Bacteriophage sp.]
MSETISDMVYRVQPSFTMRLPASTYDKARSQLEDNELLLNCVLPVLLVAHEGIYHMISDDDLLKYLKCAVRRFEHLQVLCVLTCCAADEDERLERYTSEMRRCAQVIFRIRRERFRRIIGEADEKLRE